MLDISRASLFSYRTGARPISGKAWQKLIAAEQSLSGQSPAESSGRLRDAAAVIYSSRIPLEDPLSAEEIDAELDVIIAQIERLRRRLKIKPERHEPRTKNHEPTT